VIIGVKIQVQLQTLGPLGRAPGAPKEPVDVGANHRAGVIEIKERIKATAFELALTHDTAAPSFYSRVVHFLKMRSDPIRIFWVLVAEDFWRTHQVCFEFTPK